MAFIHAQGGGVYGRPATYLAAMQLSRRSQQKFADLCAQHGTVRSIEAVYASHGFDLPAGFEPVEGGMRRSVCAAAEDGTDLSD